MQLIDVLGQGAAAGLVGFIDDIPHLAVDLGSGGLAVALALTQIAAQEGLLLRGTVHHRAKPLREAVLGDHLAGNVGGLLQIIGSTGGDILQDQLFGHAAAQLAEAKAAYERVSSLAQKGIRAETDLDSAVAALKVAEAGVSAAEANVSLAEAQVRATDVSRSGLTAQVHAAEAAVDLARINLGNTVITAPADGQISESSVRKGQYVTAGTQLMFLVPPTRWIVANYKETQTAHMQVGQPVTIDVDGLDGAALQGTVEELAPATGSEFSVLKADNASGNFTKVVQRIPVRIRLAEDQPMAERLRPGMSVIARVETAPARPSAPEGGRT